MYKSIEDMGAFADDGWAQHDEDRKVREDLQSQIGNSPSYDERMHVNAQLRECDDLVTSIDRAYNKNDKNKVLVSLYAKLRSITPIDSTQKQQLKEYWAKYNYKKIKIDAMPDEAMPSAAGGSRRRNKKSKKSKKTKKSRKSRKTKSRRH